MTTFGLDPIERPSKAGVFFVALLQALGALLLAALIVAVYISLGLVIWLVLT